MYRFLKRYIFCSSISQYFLYIKLARCSVLSTGYLSTEYCIQYSQLLPLAPLNVSDAAQEAVATAEASNLRSATCRRTRRGVPAQRPARHLGDIRRTLRIRKTRIRKNRSQILELEFCIPIKKKSDKKKPEHLMS